MGWQVLELNPAHVTAQRRTNGQRGVKTDRVDLVAIADLLLAGRGVPVAMAGEALVELAAWVAHRARRVQVLLGVGPGVLAGRPRQMRMYGQVHDGPTNDSGSERSADDGSVKICVGDRLTRVMPEIASGQRDARWQRYP
jgi:hypothetical protein